MSIASAVSQRRVQGVRDLTESAYVLRFDRDDMEFEPGQYVAVGIHGDIDIREYSIYSEPDEGFLEILVKEVQGGSVSRRLRKLEPGHAIEADGPFGFFMVDEAVRENHPVLLVATGTGISPFHCFAKSYPNLDYRLIHGVRTLDERYDRGVFSPARVTTCVSRQPGAARAADGNGGAEIFEGRVTDFLRQNSVNPETRCYLCGNCDMIYESFDILKLHGVPPEQLFAEVYF